MNPCIRRFLPRAGAAAPASSAASVAFANEIDATNGVAINGYGAVTYFTDQRPAKGSEKFAATCEGAIFSVTTLFCQALPARGLRAGAI